MYEKEALLEICLFMLSQCRDLRMDDTIQKDLGALTTAAARHLDVLTLVYMSHLDHTQVNYSSQVWSERQRWRWYGHSKIAVGTDGVMFLHTTIARFGVN